jgi:Ankyrin repeats (3 copies)
MSSSDFIQLIYKADILEIYKYLKKTNTKPYACKDEKGYTALHVASLNGTYALFEFLITYTKRNYKDWIDHMQDWANERTEENFTALHFASHRGNLVRFI